ncbi:MAG: Na+/H+ antiporter NhaA [Rhodospirillaceae bacterium]|nr:Na+/H+ antiporter NhaA [Rhodospirillaceae bacterium]
MSGQSAHAHNNGSTLRQFLDSESLGGLVLMAVAILALAIANSSLAPAYFNALAVSAGPLSVQHWINDALMALFFLMVGLEIKREIVVGELSSRESMALPAAAAIGGMAAPAAVFLLFNTGRPDTLPGWAIPAATDIAFALGVMSLLGPRVPASLKVFLTALAIIDDLGAVLIIALFYSDTPSLDALTGAGLVMLALILLNRRGVKVLWPYLILGALLWGLVLRSGLHATLAGVLLAFTVPLTAGESTPDAVSPLERLERALHKPVAFLVVPIFGFANAGVSVTGLSLDALLNPLTLGIAAALVFGKLIGVTLAVSIVVRAGWAVLPTEAVGRQIVGTALLCGIGFTMSLFVAQLAFDDVTLQNQAKLGILIGSVIAGLAGYVVLCAGPIARRSA